MGKFTPVLFRLLLPIAVMMTCFWVNIWLGWFSVFAYFAVIIYINKGQYYIYKATLAYNQKKIDEALTYYQKALRSPVVHPANKIGYGYLLLKAGYPDEAQKVLMDVLEKKGKINRTLKLDAETYLSFITWKKGRLNEAIEALEKVFEQYKTTVTYGALGYFYILQGDYDQAIEFNLKAYEYNDNDGVIMDNLGQAYYYIGNYDKSREIYERLLLTQPQFPEPYYNYGLVLLALKEQELGLTYMKRALDYPSTFLSTVSKEQIEAKIQEYENNDS